MKHLDLEIQRKRHMTKSDIYFAHTFSNISKRKKNPIIT